MISKVKKLDVRSGEGNTLRLLRFWTYIMLAVSTVVYVAVGVAQALNINPRTLNYVLLFVIAVFVAFVVFTSTIFLIKLSRWIMAEAIEHKSKLLRKTLRKNNFLIAIDVISIVYMIVQFVSAPVTIAEVPFNYFSTLSSPLLHLITR
jgi:hypothetical protein